MILRGKRPSTGQGVAIDDALRAYLSGQGLSRASALGQIGAVWSDLVGPALSSHLVPWRIDGETLIVAVDDPAWATELAFLADRILAGLESHLGTTGIIGVKAHVRTSFDLE